MVQGTITKDARTWHCFIFRELERKIRGPKAKTTSSASFLFIYYFSFVPGIELKTCTCQVGACVTELHPQLICFKNINISTGLIRLYCNAKNSIPLKRKEETISKVNVCLNKTYFYL